MITSTHDVAGWKTNNYNTHITQYLISYYPSKDNQGMKFGQLIEYSERLSEFVSNLRVDL